MEFSKNICNVRPYPCSLCNLAFKSKQFLQRHMTSHSDARDFLCQYCVKSYKYKKGLNRHIKKFHNLGELECAKNIKKHFKVEDFLDLAKDEKYRPQKVWDFKKGKEIEILFTWTSKYKSEELSDSN